MGEMYWHVGVWPRDAVARMVVVGPRASLPSQRGHSEAYSACWLLATGYWHWLLATGYWLLAGLPRLLPWLG